MAQVLVQPLPMYAEWGQSILFALGLRGVAQSSIVVEAFASLTTIVGLHPNLRRGEPYFGD